MSQVIDCYLSLQSPWSYLGHERCVEIAARHGAELRIRPADFGEIFPATGGLPLPKRAPARQAYRLVELDRWRTYLSVPLNLHPAHFPTNDKLAAGMVAAAREAGDDAVGLAGATLRAVWAEQRDVALPETLHAIAAELGMDGAGLIAEAERDAGERLAADTAAALGAGVFGAPSYIYRDQLFWGQDRLEFLDRALAG